MSYDIGPISDPAQSAYRGCAEKTLEYVRTDNECLDWLTQNLFETCSSMEDITHARKVSNF